MRVSNPKPLSGKHLLGDKHTGIDTDIQFYEAEDDNSSDSGYEAVNHVKIDESGEANNENLKRLTIPVIK